MLRRLQPSRLPSLSRPSLSLAGAAGTTDDASAAGGSAQQRLHTVCGFAFLSLPTAKAPEPLEAFLAEGDPPVCVAFGSMLALDGAHVRFYLQPGFPLPVLIPKATWFGIE